MRSNAIELDDFMQESNLQKNIENIHDISSPSSSVEALMIHKAIEEVNEDITIGFNTPQSHLEMLKSSNPSV